MSLRIIVRRFEKRDYNKYIIPERASESIEKFFYFESTNATEFRKRFDEFSKAASFRFRVPPSGGDLFLYEK